MKYLLYVLIGLGIVAVLYFGISKKAPQQIDDPKLVEESTNTAQNNWRTQTDTQPPITIAVTPLELDKSSDVWRFQILLDTHSGSLDDDLLSAASLMDDKGNTYQPLSFEGDLPGGHHREGLLFFAVIKPIPTYVELKIKDVGGNP